MAITANKTSFQDDKVSLLALPRLAPGSFSLRLTPPVFGDMLHATKQTSVICLWESVAVWFKQEKERSRRK